MLTKGKRNLRMPRDRSVNAAQNLRDRHKFSLICTGRTRPVSVNTAQILALSGRSRLTVASTTALLAA
jgi:hypothetical protein